MVTGMLRAASGRAVRRFALVGAAVVLIGLIVWAVWPTRVAPPAWAGDYDVTARVPETIAPGTVVERSAPAGWSHLVIKSLPRVRADQRSKVLPLVANNAAWMFTAFVADVRPTEPLGNPTSYRLRAIALGLGTSVGGRDVIITPETAKEHGVELNWITREILTKGYATQGLAVIVVQGPTFGLVDTPVWFRCGENHRLIRFRYALLVDELSGRLDLVVWGLDPEGGCVDSASAVVLAPDTVEEAELIPDMSKFTGGLTTADDAFGVDRLPRHRARLLLPEAIRSLATQTKFTPDQAHTLETELRRLLPNAPPP
jgi:hypothetical protein